MQKTERIDFAKLVGFETISGQIVERLDFQDETISAAPRSEGGLSRTALLPQRAQLVMRTEIGGLEHAEHSQN